MKSKDKHYPAGTIFAPLKDFGETSVFVNLNGKYNSATSFHFTWVKTEYFILLDDFIGRIGGGVAAGPMNMIRVAYCNENHAVIECMTDVRFLKEVKL